MLLLITLTMPRPLMLIVVHKLSWSFLKFSVVNIVLLVVSSNSTIVVVPLALSDVPVKDKKLKWPGITVLVQKHKFYKFSSIIYLPLSGLFGVPPPSPPTHPQMLLQIILLFQIICWKIQQDLCGGSCWEVSICPILLQGIIAESSCGSRHFSGVSFILFSCVMCVFQVCHVLFHLSVYLSICCVDLSLFCRTISIRILFELIQ